MTTATTSNSKGPPNDTNVKDENAANSIQEDEDDPFTFRSRKSYPQRHNRTKLNYRDLERGVYDTHELRQSMWALGGPTLLNRNKKDFNNPEYSDDDENDDEDSMVVEKNEKATDDSDQMHRRLWCICKKPWDHSRVMLRCDTCADWYHGDCIGITKEQARLLDINGDQFVCPPCQGRKTNSTAKPSRSSDESLIIKRKRLDAVSPSDRKTDEKNGNSSTTKSSTYSEPSKRPKTGIFFQRDQTADPQIHCIVHGCTNWAKSGWVYCSAACIRRHINDTLQAIQRSKGTDNENILSREDILLYENRTKRVLDRKLIPKVEDLCTWINQHPSYEIVKPALRQSILLTANHSKSAAPTNIIRSTASIAPTIPKTPTTPNSMKPKLSWAPVVPNTKPMAIKKAPVPIGKPISSTPTSSNVQNYADIRVKVPQALYDKLIARLEKSGETNISNDDIRTLTEKIEEEMYRVYGKVDNSYKNKFRSLLANISNTTNNYFYKHILSREVTAKQIVAMKPEDMLPPEEKEKRKDEFEKEVQMIIKAEEQSAEERARRAKIKITRQGLIDNDSILPVFQSESSIGIKDQDDDDKDSKLKSTSSKTPDKKQSLKPIDKTKKIPTSTSVEKSTVNPNIKVQKPISKNSQPELDVKSEKSENEKQISPKPSEPIREETISQVSQSTNIKSPEKSPQTPPRSSIEDEPNEMLHSNFPLDIDNDYIEPESPTGIDALLYDDDDDLNTSNAHSRPSTHSQIQHSESTDDKHGATSASQPNTRTFYNPQTSIQSKVDATPTYQPTPISRSIGGTNQWCGVIVSPDLKIPCQSQRIFGEAEYLVSDIPEQLGILGRLRLRDLWDYVRDSLPVRDVIILTLISSNNNDNNVFSRYVDTMRSLGRAAVINKRQESTSIRDMYVLAADSKDCPSNVVTSLSLSTNIDPGQLFLVVVGTGKRTTKSLNRSNQNQSLSNLTYKPVALQDTTSIRDPRLIKNKDPRSTATSSTEITSEATNVHNTKAQYSTEHLNKIMSQAYERIRQSTSADLIQQTIISTMDVLKSNDREDLCIRFTNNLHTLSSDQNAKNDNISTTPIVAGDNLNEENMEVDDEQDDKNKKQINICEFNDIDYRFIDQDMDHRLTVTAMSDNDRIHEKRNDISKSSLFPSQLTGQSDADHRINKSIMIKETHKEPKVTGQDFDFRANDTKVLPPR